MHLFCNFFILLAVKVKNDKCLSNRRCRYMLFTRLINIIWQQKKISFNFVIINFSEEISIETQ